MFEVYVLAERRKSLIWKLLEANLLALSVVFLIFSLLGIIILSPFAIVCLAIWYWAKKRYIEYEYSYFDGDVRFAKIINKCKRKRLPCYSMGDVVAIAPAGDRSVYQYENDKRIKVRNYETRTPNAKVYVMVVKGDAGLEVVRYEPDDKYLDAVCIKYPQKVKR